MSNNSGLSAGSPTGVYRVKSGDTLSAIAKKYNTTVAQLNKLNPTIAQRRASGKTGIFANSAIKIPSSSGTSSSKSKSSEFYSAVKSVQAPKAKNKSSEFYSAIKNVQGSKTKKSTAKSNARVMQPVAKRSESRGMGKPIARKAASPNPYAALESARRSVMNPSKPNPYAALNNARVQGLKSVNARKAAPKRNTGRGN